MNPVSPLWVSVPALMRWSLTVGTAIVEVPVSVIVPDFSVPLSTDAVVTDAVPLRVPPSSWRFASVDVPTAPMAKIPLLTFRVPTLGQLRPPTLVLAVMTAVEVVGLVDMHAYALPLGTLVDAAPPSVNDQFF